MTVRILLQTTIEPTADDWHIGRFAMLADLLRSQRDEQNVPIFDVTARDRGPLTLPDPVLSTLDTSDFDQLWLFAVDTGNGLTTEDCAGIGRFRQRGGGLLVTRDHMDLGSSICTLGGVGKAHHFHSQNVDPDAANQCIDDTFTTYISWPNFHSGANGDTQAVTVVNPAHAILAVVATLPAHPHEGAVSAPADDPSARVIATGCSKLSAKTFNLAIAFEASADGGRAIAQSTFHHFADYNWNPAAGCPSFVDEAPGDAITRPGAVADTHRYMLNVASWLSGG